MSTFPTGFPTDRIATYRGRITDHALCANLESMFPNSFIQAPTLITVAEKLAKKKGFFTNDETRIKNVLIELYNFEKAIESDFSKLIDYFAFQTQRGVPPVPLVQEIQTINQRTNVGKMIWFLNLFSLACPNWQEAYETINFYLCEKI